MVPYAACARAWCSPESSQLGEMIIKRFNPKDTFDFSDEAEKYLDSLKNHSLISESLGIALRKVNPFEINSHEMFSLNLLPVSTN